MIALIRARVTHARRWAAAFHQGFDEQRQEVGRAGLAEVQQSLNGMRADWQVTQEVADGVRAWLWSATLWRPFRKWCSIAAIALWYIVMLAITKYPSNIAVPIPLSVNTILDTTWWMRLEEAADWHHPGVFFDSLRTPFWRWVFLVLALHALFVGLPNAKVPAPSELTGRLNLISRSAHTIAWSATLERRFRTTALLAFVANSCGDAYSTARTPWGSSVASTMERPLLVAERQVLVAWKRWPRYQERATKHRRADLKEHAGLVAAALRREAQRLDGPERDEALVRLAEMLLTIAERYSNGHLGELLPSDDLKGLTVVRRHEGLRLLLIVGGVVAVTAGTTVAGLPEPAAAVALPALAGLVMWFANRRRGGRETGEAFDLFRPR